jgi:hypothetical protein
VEEEGDVIGALLLAAASAVPPAAARFDFEAKPYVDLHFYVRSLAASKEPRAEIAEVKGLADAVEAARALDVELGSPIAWGYVEGLIGECSTAKEGTLALAKTRETVEMPGGKLVALRAGALKLGAALEKAEPAFLEKVWPAHQKAIEEASTRIEKGFDGKEKECLADVAKHLGLPSPRRAIPVRLVYEAPFPGAVTHRKLGGGGVCFVSVKDVEGTLLLESVLHEATHALDVLARPAPGETRESDDPLGKGTKKRDADEDDEEDAESSVLDLLRARLEKAGFTRRDREWRDVPHTLMFVQAGETIRRLVDPKHVHYGIVAKYYDKMKPIADVELAAWTAYLDGKTTREEAVEKILGSVTAARASR